MKKLVLSALFALVGLIAQTQHIGQVESYQIGERSSINKDWEWYKPVDSDMTVTFIEYVVIADNAIGSKYTVGEVIYDDGNTIHWEALDENLKKCEVILTTFQREDYLIIVYESFCFRYKLNYKKNEK